MKKTNLIYYSYAALNDAAEDITKLAEVEGLSAHGSAIHVRCDKND
jgi:histidinol dehydrogenase